MRRKKVRVRVQAEPTFADRVTRGNLDDQLHIVRERMDGHWTLDDERWVAHRFMHDAVEQSLRDYKRDANEWRATLTDLRSTFLPKPEFMSEHRALESKLHGEIVALVSKVDALDIRVDANIGEIKELHVEAAARRSVFSDTRSVVATLGIVVGVIVSALLVLDRIGS